MIKKYLKQTIQNILDNLGVVIVRKSAVPSWHNFIRQVRAHNLYPKSIFDIGTAYGTPWLNQSFPNSKFYLIDPLKESKVYMQQIARKYNAKVLNFGLSDKNEHKEIFVYDDIGGSSIYQNIGSTDTPFVKNIKLNCTGLTK